MANPESWPWAGLPEPIRFIISGATGSAAFWVLNKAAIVALSPEEVQKTMPSAFTDLIPLITQAFALSYLVSIALQHTLHSTIVYGWKQDYLTGLIATYVGYGAAFAASVPINASLVSYNLTADQAWFGTLVITGIANYFLLSELLGGAAAEESVVDFYYEEEEDLDNSEESEEEEKAVAPLAKKTKAARRSASPSPSPAKKKPAPAPARKSAKNSAAASKSPEPVGSPTLADRVKSGRARRGACLY